MQTPPPLVVNRWSAPLEPARWALLSERALAREGSHAGRDGRDVHDAAAPVELRLGVAAGPATLVGAFQRTSDAAAEGEPGPFFRRGTGGGSVRVGEGSVHVGLSLPATGALVACDETRLVNRHVRPLLKALTRVGAPAHYFDRDWIAVARRPAAWIGFAHDSRTGAALVEAWIGLRTPFASGGRATFGEKRAASVEELAGKPVDGARLMDAIVEQFVAAYGVRVVPGEGASEERAVGGELAIDEPWAATREEGFGVLGAGFDGAGCLRLGGDVMASRDGIERLEARLAGLVVRGEAFDERAVLRAIDEELGAPGVVVFGLRSLAHVADVVLRAARAG